MTPVVEPDLHSCLPIVRHPQNRTVDPYASYPLCAPSSLRHPFDLHPFDPKRQVYGTDVPLVAVEQRQREYIDVLLGVAGEDGNVELSKLEEGWLRDRCMILHLEEHLEPILKVNATLATCSP